MMTSATVPDRTAAPTTRTSRPIRCTLSSMTHRGESDSAHIQPPITAPLPTFRDTQNTWVSARTQNFCVIITGPVAGLCRSPPLLSATRHVKKNEVNIFVKFTLRRWAT